MKTFRLAGRNLTVPDGEDEGIALYSKNGLVKVSDVLVTENDGGQRLTCKLKGDVAVPRGAYKLRLSLGGTAKVHLTDALAYDMPATVVDDATIAYAFDAAGQSVAAGSYLNDYALPVRRRVARRLCAGRGPVRRVSGICGAVRPRVPAALAPPGNGRLFCRRKNFEKSACVATADMVHYTRFRKARITQLVECHLAKVVVAGSSPVPRSNENR